MRRRRGSTKVGGSLAPGMPTRKEDVASAKAKAAWVLDSEASSCTKCGAKFTVRRRRHHCRLCGGVFCAACSEARASKNLDGVILAKPQRACADCYEEVRSRPAGWGSWAARRGPEPEPEPQGDDSGSDSGTDSSQEVQGGSGGDKDLGGSE